ncbi:MAG TPA: ATP-binding protein [Propionibacteriaceae bacterium]
MEGQSRPQVAGAWRLRSTGAAAALVVALVAAVLLSDLPRASRDTFSGIARVASGAVLAASFYYRYRRSEGRRRRAWTLFAVAALLATVSNFFQLLLGGPSERSALVDGSLLLSLVCGIIAVANFPLARRRGTDLARMILDGIVIGGSILFILSITVFPNILNSTEAQPAVLILPIADVVVATLTMLLFSRGAQPDRPALGLAALGFTAYAVSDFAYAVMVGRQGYFAFGSILDLGWIAGYVLIALGIRSPGSGFNPPADERAVELSPVLGTTVMFSLFLAAAGFNLFGLREATLTTPAAVLWLLVLLAVMARQIILVIDNDRLRRTLEQRVVDRNRSLRQVTEQSDLLVNAVGDGIYGVDREGLVTFVNPAATRVLGHSERALIGRSAHATFHATQTDGIPFPEEACYITEAIRDGRVTNAEDDSYLRADGLVIPVEVTTTPLYDRAQTTGAVVVFRDATERREVDRLKSEFVSMVSHELRTPLTAIRGSLGLIFGGALGPMPSAARRMVEIALVSSDRLTRLINEILDIERIESGVMSMDIADHTAAALIETTVGQVQVLAAEAGVEVEVVRADGTVRTDADRVVQTLMNLVGNAIKFSGPGTVVQVNAELRSAFVEFSIVDQGRGIPQDKLDSIFGRFEQVDSSDAREKGGSGLGLAISRSLVERLGGRIWATNNTAGGATFRFTLPGPPENHGAGSDLPGRGVRDAPGDQGLPD